GVGRVEQLAHTHPCMLKRASSALAEEMDGPVYVRVGGLVEAIDRVEHLARLLRAVRRVEVRERLPVHLLLEDREIAPQGARVELRVGGHSHEAIVPAGLRLSERSLERAKRGADVARGGGLAAACPDARRARRLRVVPAAG